MSISMKNAFRQKSNRWLSVFTLAVVMAVAMVAAGPTARAEVMGLDLTKIAKLKPVEFLPQEQFDKKTRVETETAPYNDPYLPYELRVPKDWTENVQAGVGDLKNDDKALSDTVLDILGRYIGQPKNLVRSYVVVEAMNLKYEVGLRDWFLNFILKNGFSLAAFGEKSTKELEAIYIQVIDDQTYSVRVRVMTNGPRLVMVRYYLPQDNIADERQQQAQVIASFKLVKPSTERIEKQLEYGFLDQSFFNYPESWTLQAKPIYSIERMTAKVYKKMGEKEAETLDGQIKIDVISRLLNTTLADETKAWREASKIKGYTIGKMIESIPYTYDSSIKTGKTQAYELLPDNKATMKNYEFVVSIMQGNDFYYIVSLITPARGQDFYIWSRNLEAFKIVNETLRRSNLPKVDAANPNDPYFDYMKEQ